MRPMEPFWVTLQNFRDDTLLIQIAIIAAYLSIIFLIAKKEGSKTDAAVKALLGVIFIFNGSVCFLAYCNDVPIAKFFAGPLYITIGYLFFLDIAAKRVHFSFKVPSWKRCIAFIFIALAFLFPVFGIFSGHGMIALPGVPCPLAIFTLAILSAAMPRVDHTIVYMLLAWVLVNIPKVFGHVSCYEEITLILAGAYALGLIKLHPGEMKNNGNEGSHAPE